ncbi:hypothetical protein PMAYCL1PPCAC_28271, partial [Pristionchus mayeri]
LNGDDVYKCSYCTICFSQDSGPLSSLIPCGHSACTECVRKSLGSNKDCFTCRGKVTEITQLRLTKNDKCSNCNKLSEDPSIPRSFVLPCRHVACKECVE